MSSRYKEYTLYKCEDGYWAYRGSGTFTFPEVITKGKPVIVVTPGETAGWTTGKVKGILEDHAFFIDFITERGTLYRLAKQGYKITEGGEVR